MVEAGVPYIVINYPGGWDTHSNHFATMRRQCPQLDQGLAMLLQDLHDHVHLPDDDLGEFGADEPAGVLQVQHRLQIIRLWVCGVDCIAHDMCSRC